MEPPRLAPTLASLLLLTGCCINCDGPSEAYHPSTVSGYQAYAKWRGEHNYGRLQLMAEQIVKEAIRSRDPQEQLLALYAASLSMRSTLVQDIYAASFSPIPQVKIAALHGLARSGDQRAEEALIEALSSPLGAIRFEGAHLLTQIGHPLAEVQLESLLAKAPREAEPIFPQLFAKIHTPRSQKTLRRFLLSGDPEVVAAALFAVGSEGREDLLSSVEEVVPPPPAKEGLAFALGKLSPSSEQLQSLAQEPIDEVRAAALVALRAQKALLEEAKQGNLWAIDGLRQLEADKELIELLNESEAIAVNAAVGLVRLGRDEGIKQLLPFFAGHPEDGALLPVFSSGKSLLRFELATSVSERFKKRRRELLMALQMQEWMLAQTGRLSENTQERVCHQVVMRGRPELILTAVKMLEQMHNTQRLEKYANLPGAPFVRQAANCALYRLGRTGSERVVAFLRQAESDEAISLRGKLSGLEAELFLGEPLSPQAQGALLIDGYLSLAAAQNESAVEELLHALERGHPQNRVIIAGLLLRAML